MKKLLSVLAALIIAVTGTTVTFAAYGGGGSASSIEGESSSSQQRDVCPDGDMSGSYYDGTCGDTEETTTPTEEETTTPTEEETITPTEEETTTATEDGASGTSFLDILRERNGGAENFDVTNYSNNAGNAFVLPTELAPTGASL